MRRQRNNVTILPHEVRRIVSRMLWDGFSYEETAAEVATRFPGSPKLHNSSLGAWRRGDEYRRYSEAREKNALEDAEVKAQADAMNDGRGPENMADLTAMDVVRNLHGMMKAGQITELSDLASVTKALAPILRVQIASENAAMRRREQELVAEMAAREAGHKAAMAELQARIETLTGARQVDPAAVAAKMNEVLGVSQSPFGSGQNITAATGGKTPA